MGFTFTLHSPSLFPLQNPSSKNPKATSFASLSITNHRLHHHHHRHPFLLSRNLHRPRPSPTRPISSVSFKPPLPSLFLQPNSPSSVTGPISAPAGSKSTYKAPNTLLSLLKTPLCVAVTATVLFLSHFLGKPSIALAEGVPAAPTIGRTDGAAEEEEEEKGKILEEYIQENPDDAKAMKFLVDIKLRKDDLPGAMKLVARLTELEPDEYEWPLLKGHLYGYMGETEMAKKVFEEMLEKDPLRAQAFHGLVMVAGQLDDESQTGDELGKVMERVREAMDSCRREGKTDELRDFKLLVAQIRVIEGRYAEGLELYEELVREEPRDFRPYLCQGIIYTMMGKKEEAEKKFDEYKRLMPKEHPYAQLFDDNLIATKAFAQAVEQQGQKQGVNA